MAFLFLIPRFLWHSFTRQSGLNIQRLVKTIKDKQDDEKSVTFVNRIIKGYLDSQNTLQGTICCGCRCRNVYVGYTIMYFTVKVLYVINALAQFFLLNAFLSFNFSSYGVEALNKLFSAGEDWYESPRFPRVTMCDFMVRRLGSNQHWYAVQCTLPINMYNEKIFLGIWLWLIILTVLNVFSIISWIVALTKPRRLASIKKYLRVVQTVPSKKHRSVMLSTSSEGHSGNFNDFIEYLHMDGYLIFRIFAHNTNELVAGRIIEHLYRHYPPRNSLLKRDV